MNRGRFSVRLLLILFAFNSILLSLYFLRSQPPTENPHSQSLTGNRHPQSPSRNTALKPWPILPSFLPWSHDPSAAAHSCEGYFGNGFSQRNDLVRTSDGTGRRRRSTAGWFRCFYSKTLQSSVCEGGPVRMNPDRIRMSAGGEKLDAVIGRAEEEELPSFEPGAFEMMENQDDGSGKIVSMDFLDEFVPRGAVNLHTMRGLLGSMRFVDSDEFQCSQWVEDTTILVTRFEYANLFHTITDWYSAYVSSRVTGLTARPHLVFVDGHCKSQLEEMWEALFSSLRYAKNFTGPVCFRRVILSPLGYETALFKGLTETIDCHGTSAHELRENPDDRKTARLSEFGEMLRASFNLPVEDQPLQNQESSHNVLFVRREDYLAHPRHGGRVQSRLSNEQEVFDALKRWAINHSKCKVNLVNGLFAHMAMKEQIHAIQDASVIIGAHGAGLTHIVAANSKAVILEIISSLYRRPHFELISQWRGLKYHAINLEGSHANPEEVIDKLSSIITNLGC
ncbi:hypothetical protein MRB53_030026 [Persea americana]|uniref:Uncharacterized protein n=1 Tax=Persea americana TaxID=3435 RepID=A0ACC2KL41_PERAE|nr:hypothetical protein MRB53_030026 [Persea americana]